MYETDVIYLNSGVDHMIVAIIAVFNGINGVVKKDLRNPGH